MCDKQTDNKQLLDEVEHDISDNYQGRGLCPFLPRPKAGADNTNNFSS